MPSPLPSSFASAAAGNTQDSSGRRGDGPGSGEWYEGSFFLNFFPAFKFFFFFFSRQYFCSISTFLFLR